MAKGMFATCHPAVCMTYFIAAICFAFCSMHPVYVCLSLMGAVAYAVFLKGPGGLVRSLLWFFPFAGFLVVVNALFKSAGATVLWKAGFVYITYEGLMNGLSIGGMLLAVLLWFSCYNVVMTDDKFTYLFGKVAPTVSLVVSMVSRWVPRMVARGRSVYAAQAALEGPDDGRHGRVRRATRMSTALVGLGLEDSIQTSDSMRARGYGAAHRRTSYASYPWRVREIVLMAILVAFIVVNIVGMVQVTVGFVYYPYISSVHMSWGYVTYALMLVIPFIVEAERAFR